MEKKVEKSQKTCDILIYEVKGVVGTKGERLALRQVVIPYKDIQSDKGFSFYPRWKGREIRVENY